MSLSSTRRLYFEDDHQLEAVATVVAARADALAFDQTCFYAGGGGQPPDEGTVSVDGTTLAIASAHADAAGVIWHVSRTPLPPALVGNTATLAVDRARRLALSRYHTVLHVLNTLALRHYGGWITGAQIGTDYARIDFKLDGFSAALVADLERAANAVLAADHVLAAGFVPEAEFRQRADLRRTLAAEPPIIDGRVRVVAIEEFDAQACGGTHVHRTSEVGRLAIYRTENKGKINKRLYVRLADPGAP